MLKNNHMEIKTNLIKIQILILITIYPTPKNLWKCIQPLRRLQQLYNTKNNHNFKKIIVILICKNHYNNNNCKMIQHPL